MTLRLEPHNHNTYPIGGLLIRGTSVSTWVSELQRMGLSLTDGPAYPLPGPVVNSVWGCLVVLPADATVAQPGPNELCQLVDDVLFMPERAALWPALAEGELPALLRNVPYLLHPDIGFVELTDSVDWPALLTLPAEQPAEWRTPAEGVYIPTQVRSFRVVPMAPDEALDALAKGVGEAADTPIHKPLSWRERLKLWLLRLLFRNVPDNGKPTARPAKPTGLVRWLERLFSSKKPAFERLRQDFERLAERNQHQLDQLLKLLRDNPELALRYAIPLDTEGTSRGDNAGGGALFEWSVRWLNFSLLNNPGVGRRGGGAATLEDEQFAQLREQYNQTARDLEAHGDYRKAAFVYLKLLKEPHRAAQTLETGKLYQEAAALYLKTLNNKVKAAACYEQGAMLPEAIALYKELNDHEKVGDLYCLLNRRAEAMPHYQTVVDNYVDKQQFVKASLLCRQKMGNPSGAQHLLLSGWRNGQDAFNCLNNYFANIADSPVRHTAIETVYQEEVSPANREVFLKVLRYEFEQQPPFSNRLRDMAYEIIAAEATQHPGILAQLAIFSPGNKLIAKDVARYRTRT
jgi:tetratricopeptide (TPR) repeat protein